MSPRRAPEERIDLSSPRRVHVVGVGGPGMSPLAVLMKGLGHEVSGSDLKMSSAVEAAGEAGIPVSIGHSADHVAGVEIVTYSTAVPADNPELAAARDAGATVCHRSAVLAALCSATESVAVAGTHGKTTTSALLTHLLASAGLEPSCIVGAQVPGLVNGARVGSGALFVLEADESDGTLDVLVPRHLVLTNVDVDHLDYFDDLAGVQQCFVDAAVRTGGFVVLNADDDMSSPVRAAVSKQDRCVTFGVSGSAHCRVSEFSDTERGSSFVVSMNGESQRFDTHLRGMHNALNCAAAVAMAGLLGVDLRRAAQSAATFEGVGRRFTERGTLNGVTLVDDYAHLPAEIAAALAAARSHPSATGRVIAVFQPNRFHRIAAMADAYAHCFEAADHVVITDVYASGTAPIEGVTGELVVDAVRAAHPHCDIVWAPRRGDIVRAVSDYMRPGDICISMGCGDIETFPDDLIGASR